MREWLDYLHHKNKKKFKGKHNKIQANPTWTKFQNQNQEQIGARFLEFEIKDSKNSHLLDFPAILQI